MPTWNYTCKDFIGEGLEEGRAIDCNAGLTEQKRQREVKGKHPEWPCALREVYNAVSWEELLGGWENRGSVSKYKTKRDWRTECLNLRSAGTVSCHHH